MAGIVQSLNISLKEIIVEGYFILISDPHTFERQKTIDVADLDAANDIYKSETDKGNHVSLWKATRIRVTQ